MTDTTNALAVLHETVGRPAPVLEKDTARWTPGYWETLSGILPWTYGGDGKLTVLDAIQISAVLACVDVIAQDLARAPLRLMRRLPNRGAEEVEPRAHWLARMLATEPSPWHTWTEFREMVAAHLCLQNNAFIVKKGIRNDGAVDELLPMVPSAVEAHARPDRLGFYYTLSLHTQFDDVIYRQVRAVLRDDQVVHIRTRVLDGFWGLSTVWAGSAAMSFAKAVVDFQTRTYENDAQVRGVFEQAPEKEALSNEAFQRLRQQLSEQMTAFRRLAKPLVLEGGLTFKGITQTAEQAEVAKAHTQALATVARVFRLPAHKIGALDNVKYDNYAQIEKDYIAGTLVPRWHAMAERLEKALLLPDERPDFFLEFDREAVELEDATQRQERVFGLLDRGTITIDEARMRLGMNPLPKRAGEVRMMPGNMTMIDEDNQVVFRAGGNAPDGATSGDGEEGPPPSEERDIIPFNERRRA